MTTAQRLQWERDCMVKAIEAGTRALEIDRTIDWLRTVLSDDGKAGTA